MKPYTASGKAGPNSNLLILSTLKTLLLARFHWVKNTGLEERLFQDDLLGHPLLSPAIRGNMPYRAFYDCDKERMSHTSLLDTRLLIDTVQVAFRTKGKSGILMEFRVGKGCALALEENGSLPVSGARN